MARFSQRKTLRHLRENAWTGIVVNRQGEIVDLVRLDDWPTPEFVAQINERYPGFGFKLLPRGEYGRSDLDEVVADMLHGFALLDQGLLKPGATCL